jgi:hypothetical protein
MRTPRIYSSSAWRAFCRNPDAKDGVSALPRWLAICVCAAGMALAGCGSGSNDGTNAGGKEGAAADQAGGTSGLADSAQLSPVAQAVEKGNLKALEGLLEEGAEVNTMEPVLARTPLHSAGFFRREKSAALLIDKGAEVNAKDISGLTPLHTAVLGGSEPVVALLLEKGADVNAATDDGSTPLHMAAAVGEYQIAKQLLAQGADRERLDKRGQPPRFYASRNNHDQTATLLQKVDKKDSERSEAADRAADKGERKGGA